ncbi:ankyrin repeat-containing domain protein [Xylaria digitata]|nr:ankyrin repeat-containing domain protein [Xylaria digitata]
MSPDSLQGLSLLTPAQPGQVDPSDITIDIVAVPGLGADPNRSFGSETDTKFNWLEDSTHGIPREIPGARVLLYHYDSRWLGGQAIRQTLYNAANWLLDALVEHRKGYESRPLVFLAHSMGGLVVAKALTLAVAKPEEIDKMRIYECFAGAIFFGTPFRGSSAAYKGVLLASILEKIDRAKSNQMLEMLDPQRDSLEELRNDFSELATQEPRATIACIWEMKELSYGPKIRGLSAIMVTPESATLDFANSRRGMEADHRQLNRFDNAQDPRYRTVIMLLKDIVQKSHRIVKKRLKASKQSLVDDETFVRLSKTLNVVELQSMRRKVESASGDSSWFLKEPHYRQWSNPTDSSNILWVSGVEGRGKGKAALLAVEELEELEKNKSKDVLVAYFFCDSSIDSCKPENMLKSLIWQLILKRRNLGQYAKGIAAHDKSQSVSTGSDSISLSRLWKTLRQILRDPSLQTVYFVLNNLHNFSQDDKNTAAFFRLLNDDILMASENDADDGVNNSRWMFLSRPQDHIKQILGDTNSGTLWIDLEDGSRDAILYHSLQSYIPDRVKKLATYKKYNLALRFLVTSILSKRATSQLWVEVVCLLLEGIPSNHVQVRKTVEALPQSLDDLISRTWRESLSVDSKGIDTSKEILRTLAIAYEDPTIDELIVMADLDSEDDKVDAARVYELIRACGPLLRVYSMDYWDDLGSHRVTFIHPMAKDALLSQATSRKLIGLTDDGDDQTEVKWQHGILALRCFGHVLTQLGVDDDSSQWVPNPGSADADSTQDKDEKMLMRIFPDEEEVEEEELYALDYPVKFWLRHGNDSTPGFSSARSRWWSSYAHVAALDGHSNLAPMHLKSHGNANQVHVRDSWHHQPLHWAAFQGHDVTMARLLEIGADVNDGESEHRRTPLHMAAASGQTRAIELLINNGAEVNSISEVEGTPLTFALSWNREQAAELLLSRGASSTLTSEDSDSPMALAALKGFKEENMVSKNYGSALAAAASAGHSSIPEARQRAVTEAAKNGYQDIVKLILLDTYHLNIDEIIRELWAYNQANRTLSYDSLNNALYKAVDNEHESIVAFLLGTCGASANATGEEYGTAVTASAFDGTMEILNMLIKAGVDLNDVAGWPLQAAASQGLVEVVALLLRNGAAVNAVSRGFPDGTALQAAVVAGHDKVAELLLDHGADPNLGAGPYTNPITAATACRHSSLIELLLSRRANPNVFGGSDNSTPLINAALKLPAEDLGVLIRYGAQIDTADPDGDTALIISAYVGDDDCINRLLDHGANVNFCGKKRGTALHAAAAEGYVKTCRLLLERGADPTIRGGPYDTVLQAACYGEEKEVVQMLLSAEPIPNLTLRDKLRQYRHKIDVNAQSQTSDYSTALHAAAIGWDEACLRLLLKQKPALDIVDKNGVTPLQAACLEGCNRNARLLLEAGADPNKGGGAHGTALQAATLKGSPELIDLLLEHDAKTTEWGGKYFSPLVAAVVRDYHWEDTGVLETLLGRDFSVDAYRAALQRAYFLGRKDAFRLIWKSAVSKGPKKLPNLGLKNLLKHYVELAERKQIAHTTSHYIKEEDENEDFPWGFQNSQDIDDEVTYEEEAEDDREQNKEGGTATATTTRGIDGGTGVRSRGCSGAGNQRGLPGGVGLDGDGQLGGEDARELRTDSQGEIQGEEGENGEAGNDTREIDGEDETGVQADDSGEGDQDVTSREIEGEAAEDEEVQNEEEENGEEEDGEEQNGDEENEEEQGEEEENDEEENEEEGDEETEDYDA